MFNIKINLKGDNILKSQIWLQKVKKIFKQKKSNYTCSSTPSIIPGYISQPFECVSIYFVA